METPAIAKTKTETYRLDVQVGYIRRLVSQRHAAIFQHHTIKGLTPTQFAAMIRIQEVSRCSQNQLGRLTAMDGATVKGVVDRLDKKGLLCLIPDPHDKRRTVISLSDNGADLMEKLHQIGTSITQDTMYPLTSAEQRTILKLLDKLT